MTRSKSIDAYQAELLAWLENHAAPWRTAGAQRGWRYATQYDLVLDLGRFFAPPTEGEPDPAATRLCYAAAARLARTQELAYVEGYALTDLRGHTQVIEHAWCSTADATAIDSAWGAGGGHAYLGIPITDQFRATVTRRARCAPAIHAYEADNFRLLKNGLPADVVLNLGTPPRATR